MKHHNQFVRCLENIQDLSGQKLYKYAVLVAGGMAHSKKTIRYYPASDMYQITNHIDRTKQVLTAKDMRDPKKTNIGTAMKKRCLIALID